MYKNHKIGVVVPAFNEENLILETLNGMPGYVDVIFVVDDASTDRTLELIESQARKDRRIVILCHEKNRGLGRSVSDGYLESLKHDVQITAVMDGDNQMHPDDLPMLLDRIIDEGYDYAKGNRLLHGNIDVMPKYRLWGNSILTIMTKFATGYYSLMDPQCAYTAIKNAALAKIPIEKMTPRYAYNADILCMLNIRRSRVSNVEVRPVYGKEKSKIKLIHYIPHSIVLLKKLFFRRMWQRYVILDFHPLVLFYLFSFFNLFFLIIPLTIRFFILYARQGQAPQTTLIILIFTLLITFQSILFAIWMDMDYNKQLTHA